MRTLIRLNINSNLSLHHEIQKVCTCIKFRNKIETIILCRVGYSFVAYASGDQGTVSILRYQSSGGFHRFFETDSLTEMKLAKVNLPISSQSSLCLLCMAGITGL